MFTSPIGLLNPKVGGIPRNGLIGEWLMAGNLTDTSGEGNNGTATGWTLTTGKDGVPNTAYENTDLINGDKIDISNTVSLFNFDEGCMSIWVLLNINIHSGEAGIFSIGESSTTSNFLAMRSSRESYPLGAVRYRNRRNAVNTEYLKEDLTAATWTHLVMNWIDGGTCDCYVNGAKVGDYSYTKLNNTTNINLLYIGKKTQGDANISVNGKVSLARLYNRKLTFDEITTLYGE